MLGTAPADHLAAELGASRKDGLNHGLLLAGHEFYGDPKCLQSAAVPVNRCGRCLEGELVSDADNVLQEEGQIEDQARR
jgi:hypothetical protein